MAETVKATVATPTAAYDDMEDKRALCRTLMIGTGKADSGDGSFLDQSSTLLPQYNGEFYADYLFRRDHLTVVPPEFPDSVDSVVSAILNGPVMFEDTEPTFYDAEAQSGDWTNVDRAGRHGDAFLSAVGTESIAEALPAVFVDWSEADQRPYWTHLHAVQLIELDYDGDVLVRARYQDDLELQDPENEWATKTVKRIRVLRRGDPSLGRESPERYAGWQLWVKDEKREEWRPQEDELVAGEKPEGRLTPPAGLSDELAAEFVEIPLYPFYSGYRSPGVAWPPLRHQAELIRLWVLLHSDFASSQHYAANPREVISGCTEETFSEYNPQETPAGKGNLMFLPRGGTYGIESHSGESFDSLQAFLDKLREDIQRAGIETMRARATGRELATLGLLERERKLTRLEVISLFWQSALQQCLRRDQLLRGLEPVATFAFPEPNTGLLIAPQMQLKLLEIAAGHDKADPETFWERAKAITGDESIEPREIVERLLAYQNSVGL